MALSDEEQKKNIEEAPDDETGEDFAEEREKKLFSYGIVYSISIIFILFIILSFYFISELESDDLPDQEEAGLVIGHSDYPDFFLNDTSHYPAGEESVSTERCLLCHDDKGTEKLFSLRGFILYESTDQELTQKCFVCHVDPKHKIRFPYNTCIECHYQETTTHNALSLSFNNILSKLGEIDNEFCIECHAEECSEIKGLDSAHVDTCTGCHNDHKKIPGCLDCHDPSFIGPYHDLGSVEFEICTNCHLGGTHTLPIINDKMDCNICHSDLYENRLKEYGGRHYTNETIQGCDSCHTAHKEYPDCRDCHGDFPDHLEDTAVSNPNQECTKCHTGGAHDSRVDYRNYNPDLGDKICEVCHQMEYDVYYELSSPGELEKYGNCLKCHEEHNANITVPHLNTGKFLNCSICHEGYSGAESMHIISNTSFTSFPYNEVPDEFCSNCHQPEYQVIMANITAEFLDSYGGCTDCHIDHKAIKFSHSVDSPYDDCINCHTTFTDSISIHNPSNISYEDFPAFIDDQFCTACHDTQIKALSDGAHASNSCVECHQDHRMLKVDFDVCTSCHESIPTFHDESLDSCQNCHDTSVIHTDSRN